jgi:hypothetical protein
VKRLKAQHLMIGFLDGTDGVATRATRGHPRCTGEAERWRPAITTVQRVGKRLERVARAVGVSPAPQGQAGAVTVVCANWSSFYCTSYCFYIYRAKISITFQQNHFRAREAP